MKGIVLAGVHRWDKASFEGTMPRPLVPVGHWPLISYALSWLHEGGLDAATICANSSSRLVRSCLGDGASLHLSLDYYEDWIPRGPAGCVRDAGEIDPAEVFLVVEATTIPVLNMADLLRAHRESRAMLTVVLSEDKPILPNTAASLAPAGLYVFSRQALGFIQETGYHDIKEVLIPRLNEKGERVNSYIVQDSCLRVRDAWTYLAANDWVLEQLAERRKSLAGYRLVEDGCVHESAKLGENVRLVGPVLIGPKTRIGSSVTLVGPTTIGSACEIGEGTLVSRSAIWNHCRIGRRSRLDRCLLTHEAKVASGETLVNAVLASMKK